MCLNTHRGHVQVKQRNYSPNMTKAKHTIPIIYKHIFVALDIKINMWQYGERFEHDDGLFYTSGW